MRTNIILDDDLVERAQTLTGIRTKRAVIQEALRMLILMHEQAEIRQLRGRLRWDGDLATSRQARLSEQ